MTRGFSDVFAPLLQYAMLAAALLATTPAQAGTTATRPADASGNDGARLTAIGERLARANREQCDAPLADSITPAPSRCSGRYSVVPDKSLNAWADGRNVGVTSQMMRMAASEDTLAFVVAHEMAHNILAHAERLKGISSNFVDADAMKRVKQTEIEADALAIELVARAGFDPAASRRFLTKVMKHRNMKMPGTHPGLAQRLAVVERAIRDLHRPAATSSEK